MKTIKEVDAGFNIEIPREILDKLFNNLLDHYMQEVEDTVVRIKGDEWNEDRIYDEVDRITSRTLGISLNVLDHIMHGEYVIV